MKVIGKLKAILGLDDKQFQKGLDKSKASANKFSSQIKKLGATIAGAFAVNKIFDFAKKSVEAAGIQEQAEAKLRAAIEANGKAVDETFKSHVEFASQLQKLTTVGDETTIQLLQMAEAMQSDAPQQAAQGAIALSKAYGMNLQAALKGVVRAQAGDYQMLQRYIPALQTASTEVEKHAIFQKALADGFEIAKAEALTGTGAIKQMQNALGDVMERIGAALLPVLTKWADKIKEAAIWIQDNEDKVKKWATALGIAVSVLGAAKIAMVALNIAMKANPIGLIISALGILVSAFTTAYKTSDKFRAIVIYVAESVAYHFQIAFALIKSGVQSLYDTIKTYFSSIGDSAKVLWDAIKAIFTKGKSPGQVLKEGFAKIAGDFKDLGKRTGENFRKNFEGISKPNFQEILAKETAEKAGEESGKAAGAGFAKGMQQGMIMGMTGGIGGAQGGEKMQGLGITPFDTETVEPQLANMDAFIQKNNEMAAALQNTGANSQVVSSIIGNAFQGMQTSISDALANSKNILQAFWTFFKDWIKGLIIKLIAAATAAATLFALLSLTGIKVGGLSSASKFKDVFGAISGIKSMAGMANGGVVPPGYPNDTYPAMLTSGEIVTPPDKLPTIAAGGGRSEELKTRISGQDIEIVLQKWGRNKNRIT